METARITRLLHGIDTRDGAGVRLRRIFAHGETEDLDPFLLLDWFGSRHEAEYVRGFPWHPHRGITTVTYLLEGSVRHGDSLGNSGTIGPGDLQWMTAGSGVIHEEMPQPSPGGVSGFQLWLNLASGEKMCDPQYCDIRTGDRALVSADGAAVLVLAGTFRGTVGPVRGVPRSPVYLDIDLAPGARLELPRPDGSTAFAFAFKGSLEVSGRDIGEGECALFGPGSVVIGGGPAGGRCIYACAQPLREPVAWGGPIVMNTREELDLAFRELDEGIFIKKGGA